MNENLCSEMVQILRLLMSRVWRLNEVDDESRLKYCIVHCFYLLQTLGESRINAKSS